MVQIRRDYVSGRIGITPDGELIPLRDIYEDMAGTGSETDYHIAPMRDLDRAEQRYCPHCATAYRITDQRDADRCPYCWRLT